MGEIDNENIPVLIKLPICHNICVVISSVKSASYGKHLPEIWAKKLV